MQYFWTTQSTYIEVIRLISSVWLHETNFRLWMHIIFEPTPKAINCFYSSATFKTFLTYLDAIEEYTAIETCFAKGEH